MQTPINQPIQSGIENATYAHGENANHSDTHPDPNKRKPLLGITRAEILQLIESPTSKPKKQSPYVIPSTLRTRTFKTQSDDGQYGFGWMDIDKNNVSKEHIITAFQQMMPGQAFYIYSTHSYTPDVLKWRILWFYTSFIETGALWYRYQMLVINTLMKAGIEPDATCARSAQMCYLPNSPEGHYDSHIEPGDDIDPAGWLPVLPPAPVAPVRDGKALAESNPNFAKLMDQVEIIADRGDKIDIVCPWAHEHSGGADQAWLSEPSAGENQNKGGFNCMHDHCSGRNIGTIYSLFDLSPTFDALAAFPFPDDLPDDIIPPGAVATIKVVGDQWTPMHNAMAGNIKTGKLFGATPDEIEKILHRCADASVQEYNDICESISHIDPKADEYGDCIKRLKHCIKTADNGYTIAAIKRDVKIIANDRRMVLGAISAKGLETMNMGANMDGEIIGYVFVRKMAMVAAVTQDALGYREITLYSRGQFFDREREDFYDAREDKYVKKSEAWFNTEGARLEVDGITFVPTTYGKAGLLVRTGSGDRRVLLNTYVEPEVDPVCCDEVLVGFKNHVLECFCDGDEEQAKTLWQWLAFILQRPLIKPQYALVMKAAIGVGKSKFMEVLGELFGSTHAKVSGNKLASKFIGQRAYKMLITTDEVELGKEGSAVLRDLITTKTIDVEQKGKDSFSVRDYCSFIISSNKEQPYDLEDGDRRGFWLDINADPGLVGIVGSAARRAYMAPFIASIEDERFLSALYHELLHIDIEGFNPWQAPCTEKQIEALENNRPPFEQYLEEIANGVLYRPAGSDKGAIQLKEGSLVTRSVMRQNYQAYLKDTGMRCDMKPKAIINAFKHAQWGTVDMQGKTFWHQRERAMQVPPFCITSA